MRNAPALRATGQQVDHFVEIVADGMQQNGRIAARCRRRHR